VALWGAGEGLVALACLQVLGLYLGLVALRLSLGFPLTW
jgi:hypothetical protein